MRDVGSLQQAETNNIFFWISFQKRLLLAGDTEVNPGPINDEREDKILKAIKDSESRLLGRMDRLDIKINNIKAEMNNVKQQFKISEDEMKLIKEEQSKQAYLLINLQSENEQ